jgi:hypothetical protein
VIKETDLTMADGRTLHCYDSGEAGGLDDGHVSVLGSCAVAALDWLVARA